MGEQDSGEISSEKDQTLSQLQSGISKREHQPLSKDTSDLLGYIIKLDPEQIERVLPPINEFLNGEASRQERKATLNMSKTDDLYKKILSLILIIIGGLLISKDPTYNLEIGCFIVAVGLSHTFKIPLGDLANILNRIVSK